MEFTIYTFGDVEIFRAALAGVAMVFNADGYFVSNDGVGLGALAGLGILIGLVGMLFEGVMRQRFALGEFLMLIIVFVVLFVPKFSVNVEDYNGAAIAKVDNVPLGVALPAGLISGLANEMNKKMATAFSTVYGYPSGMMTPQALVGPLKLLQSLSATGPVMNDYEPRLGMNIRNLMAYCIAGRAGQANRWARIRIGEDPIPKMVTEAGTQRGLAVYVDLGGNEGMRTCSDASSRILDELNIFMSASGPTTFMSASGPTAAINSVLTAAAARNGAATVQIVNNTPYVLPVDVEQQKSALAMLAQTEAELAVNLVRSAIFTPDISAAMACSGQSPLPEDWAKCMPFQEATLKFNVDAAAAGSFFQRLMTGGMNVLFFVWICLSPVVAVVMLMKGITGLKLAGNYLFFGAWTVSWYVGASIINFYMLKQVQYEVAMLGGIANLTPGTLAQFLAPHGILATKIAIAGDMMASVPILMMSIMGGSMYAMTRVADRWSGRDYYDESRQAPGVSESKPLYGRESMAPTSYFPELGLGGQKGFQSPGALNTQAVLGNAIKDAQSTTEMWSNAQSAAVTNALANTWQHGKMGEIGGMMTTGLQASGANALAAVNNLAHEIDNSTSMTDSQKKEAKAALGAALRPGIDGLAAGFDYSMDRAHTKLFSQGAQDTLTKLESGSQEFRAQLTREASSTNMSKFLETGSKIDAQTDSSTWADTQQYVKSHADAHTTEQSISAMAGMSKEVQMETLARMTDANPRNPDALAIHRNAGEFKDDNVFQQLLGAKTSNLKHSSTIRGMDDNAIKAVAELQTMAAIQPAAFMRTVQEMEGSPALKVASGQHGDVDTSQVRSAGAVKGAVGDPQGAASGLLSQAGANVRHGATTVTGQYAGWAQQALNLGPSVTVNGVSDTRESETMSGMAAKVVGQTGTDIGQSAQTLGRTILDAGHAANKAVVDGMQAASGALNPSEPPRPESKNVSQIPKGR